VRFLIFAIFFVNVACLKNYDVRVFENFFNENVQKYYPSIEPGLVGVTVAVPPGGHPGGTA
jgi:hypothetical protein